MRHRLPARVWIGALLMAIGACGDHPAREPKGRVDPASAASGPSGKASSAARAEPPSTLAVEPPARSSGELADADTGGAPAARAAPDEARGPALKAALHDVHRGILEFYVRNSRFPLEQGELEADPELAGPLARLEELGTALRYASNGGSFSLTLLRADGPPITLSGDNRRHRRTPPPAPTPPAGT